MHTRRASDHETCYPLIGRVFARQTVEISLLIDPAELRARLDRPFDVDELTVGLDNETYLVAILTATPYRIARQSGVATHLQQWGSKTTHNACIASG